MKSILLLVLIVSPFAAVTGQTKTKGILLEDLAQDGLILRVGDGNSQGNRRSASDLRS